jgi:hypothetical protein
LTIVSPSHEAVVPPSVVERLREEFDVLTDQLMALYRHNEPAYQDVADHDLRSAIRAHLDAAVAELAGEARDRATALATGRRRAEQGIPLSAVLSSYRAASRVVWDAVVRNMQVTQMSSDTLLRLTNAAFDLAAEYPQAMILGFQQGVAARTARDAAERDGLVRALFAGRLQKIPQLRGGLAALGLPTVGNYLVVALRPTADSSRVTDLVDRHLQERGGSAVWQVDPEVRLGLLQLPGGEMNLDRVMREMSAAWHASRVGVSEPFSRVEQVSQAADRAMLASAAASPGTPLRYDAAGLATLVASAPDEAAALAERVLAPVLQLPRNDRVPLLETLHAWFQAGGSPAGAAEALHVHPNTVRYRLHRLERLTGRPLSDPRTVAEVYAALEALRIQQAPGN